MSANIPKHASRDCVRVLYCESNGIMPNRQCRGCGNHARNAFCYSCWRRLPEPMQAKVKKAIANRFRSVADITAIEMAEAFIEDDLKVDQRLELPA